MPNGSAAGNSMEEAVLQGFLELVELNQILPTVRVDARPVRKTGTVRINV